MLVYKAFAVCVVLCVFDALYLYVVHNTNNLIFVLCFHTDKRVAVSDLPDAKSSHSNRNSRAAT